MLFEVNELEHNLHAIALEPISHKRYDNYLVKAFLYSKVSVIQL